MPNGGQLRCNIPPPGADIRAVPAWDLWTGDPDFRIAGVGTGVLGDYYGSLLGVMSSN